MGSQVRNAVHDPALSVQITARRPMLYAEGGSGSADRPGFVASASSLSTLGEFLFVVQDSANWLAVIHPDGSVSSLPLPRGPGGVRVYNDQRHNTDEKADLEACVIVDGDDGPELIAFGSGTGESSCSVVRIRGVDRAPRAAEVSAHFCDAALFYASLRDNRHFTGGRLNIEGAIALDGDRILLFQRGNASPDQGEAVNATAEVSWSALKAHLDDPSSVPPPALEQVTRYELGEIGGVPLTFSDAEYLGGGRVLFSASAEEPKGTDGGVVGSAIGLIEPGGEVRWGAIHDEQGAPFTGKIEGLSFPPDDPSKIRFVIDDDDENAPSEIYDAVLSPGFGVEGQGR